MWPGRGRLLLGRRLVLRRSLLKRLHCAPIFRGGAARFRPGVGAGGGGGEVCVLGVCGGGCSELQDQAGANLRE